ncbi:chromosome segregation protein SMC [Aquibacillus koreensis]|uniref:Chromosome partition protein Smc n=1 Tax=Aquibacillus koreensis TaxID=279446 RepID=A0A9X4AL04_9BACI|nr:chromosome segregation protein SMC [Aquibacillus koreensis]MCT2534493.1 chromosome segregation protein SMC [Aquibacillus koreensis]MDC3421913.1 chromosome segregation protein SMC [Aquibacillus koreensis]
MFLKQLDTVGFKSFAERVTVDFVPGVTAVVGPNGSGKSNITDAIRWVLGEQSAKSLRGSKMEDIIFQGSDSRKPLNVAEVTLTLDNTDQMLPVDYEEVSVTRRVYRSGDSEFLLNKQPCRLKDIIDLFLDSGLGREAFSIISQGKVEEILSSKAEERRTIFEEAAGVLKYKNRKKKAEYKLAETQENLNRVEDIIHEIENQLDPLKQQAATAKDYLAKKDELKEKEISLLITEIEHLHKDWTTLLEELEGEKREEIQLKTRIQQQEANVEHDKSKMKELDDSIELLQQDLLVLTQELEKLEGTKKLISERSMHFESNKAKLEMDRTAYRSRITKFEHDHVQELEKLNKAKEKRDYTKRSILNLKEELSTTEEDIEEQIEELKSEYIERLNQQAAHRNERQSIEKQLAQIGTKKDSQDTKFQDMANAREKVESELQALQLLLKEKQETSQQLQDNLHQLKQEIDKGKDKYQELQTKLYQGYQYIEKMKSKKEMLEDMKEDFQGFFQGVKEVLKAREENVLQDIHGAVIELLDVPTSYITAIETALGGQAQHVVVKDEAVARHTILWLKKTNKGRATFLPMTAMKGKFISKDQLQNVTNHTGYIGVASDLITFNSKYDNVMKYLLGNVVIAETLKDANEIAIKLSRRFRVVTLEGDVVNPGGSMSGGAQKKTNQSLFTREKDLQEMVQKIEEYETKAIEFESKVKSHKQLIDEKERNLEKMRIDMQHAQQEEQDVKSKMTEKELNISHLNDNLRAYDQDKLQYESDYLGLKERANQLEESLTEMKKELEEIQITIDQLTRKHAEHKQNKDQIQETIHQLEITLAEQEAQVKNYNEKVESLKSVLDETRQSLQEKEEQLNQLLEIHHNGDTEEEIDEKLQEKQQEKDRTTQLIQTRRQERMKQTQRITDVERELKEQNRIHQSMIYALQDKEVKANRLDVELENRLQHLQSEYLITFEKAQKDYEKVTDMESAKREVKLLKLSMDELGTVNLGAIEEYERIAERYEFLTEQQTDLVQAKETLYGVISEMDEEMKRKFESTFYQIKEEFTVVFQQLFGGGRAELKLTDPENLLDTGVEIIAQPPGKKSQHLGLLSGGERALTAIALLFAILRVRPVPFCVLDEVEAALDDANVNRFARYLKHYSEKTQFIVITHRKGTMEEADVLYGVTMQESGVSRLVSVKLEDTPELVKA